MIKTFFETLFFNVVLSSKIREIGYFNFADSPLSTILCENSDIFSCPNLAVFES